MQTSQKLNGSKMKSRRALTSNSKPRFSSINDQTPTIELECNIARSHPHALESQMAQCSQAQSRESMEASSLGPTSDPYSNQSHLQTSSDFVGPNNQFVFHSSLEPSPIGSQPSMLVQSSCSFGQSTSQCSSQHNHEHLPAPPSDICHMDLSQGCTANSPYGNFQAQRHQMDSQTIFYSYNFESRGFEPLVDQEMQQQHQQQPQVMQSYHQLPNECWPTQVTYQPAHIEQPGVLGQNHIVQQFDHSFGYVCDRNISPHMNLN